MQHAYNKVCQEHKMCTNKVSYLKGALKIEHPFLVLCSFPHNELKEDKQNGTHSLLTVVGKVKLYLKKIRINNQLILEEIFIEVVYTNKIEFRFYPKVRAKLDLILSCM